MYHLTSNSIVIFSDAVYKNRIKHRLHVCNVSNDVTVVLFFPKNSFHFIVLLPNFAFYLTQVSASSKSMYVFTFQRDIRDCNILCFTETWLSREILSLSIQPAGFSVYLKDRNKKLSGKKKGGSVCFRIHHSWCDCDNIQKLKSFFSPDLEYLTIKC